jgi:SRSO17 transposase
MMADYSSHFVVRGKDVNKHATDYISGLLGTDRRKNLECIHDDVPESNYQGMQQFVSDSPWDEKKLMNQVALEVNGILGGHPQSALLIDESSFVKKGNSSVGVQRQYCGRLGKKENCQMGVFACLGRGEKAAVVDFRLFLPESWVQAPPRCEQAQIPEEQRHHRTKLELALEMVGCARTRGLQFEWVLADAAYGCSKEFCGTLELMGLLFMCDTAATNRVWDADPQPKAEKPSTGRGRPVSHCRAGNQSARKWKVSDLAKARLGKEGREIVIRKTTQGELRARVWIGEVWVWSPGEEKSTRRTLVAREMEDGEIKTSWTNAPATMSWESLAYMQAQRHWVERTFQDCKSQLGMAQYEVRKWRGWHHHMALVSLAMLFVLKERVAHSESAPLLSARDIVELLEYYLPRRGGKEEEVVADLVRRHKQRLAASKSHAKRARKKSLIT